MNTRRMNFAVQDKTAKVEPRAPSLWCTFPPSCPNKSLTYCLFTVFCFKYNND